MLEEDLWVYHLYVIGQETCLLYKLDRYFDTKEELEKYLIKFSIEYFKRFPDEDDLDEIYIENARAEKIIGCKKIDLKIKGLI